VDEPPGHRIPAHAPHRRKDGHGRHGPAHGLRQRRGTSGAGVGFSRDPASGENRLYLDFRFNSQGEDVVSGQHSAPDTARLAATLPHVLSRLESMAEILEREFGDVQEFEFTVQDGVLYLLQTRSAKRTPGPPCASRWNR
jgi:phosphoenolpyruvate synthase/pyruvate phosphate dikinase